MFPSHDNAAQYGHQVSSLVTKAVRQAIYDAAPLQYFDLKILGLKAPKQVNSDEHFYHEIGFGRDPIVVSALNAPISAAQVQTIPVANMDSVAIDTIVVYPGNERGTITQVNSGAGTVVVTAPSGTVLPQIPG